MKWVRTRWDSRRRERDRDLNEVQRVKFKNSCSLCIPEEEKHTSVSDVTRLLVPD